MPGLLDIYLGRQSPAVQSLLGGGLGQQQGPLSPAQRPQPQQVNAQQAQAQQQQAQAQAAAQARQQKMQAAMQRAGQAVSQQQVPGVSPAQRLDARETLLTTGMALLAGGGQITLGQAVATGLFAGRQAAAINNQERAAEQAAQQRAQQYMSVLGNGPLDRDKITKGIQIATINGDGDTRDALTDLLDQFPEDETAKRSSLVVDGEVFFTDDGGNLYRPNEDEPLARELLPTGRVKPDKRKRVLSDGTEEEYLANPYTGEEVPNSAVRTGIAPRDPRYQPVPRVRLDENGNEVSFFGDPFTGQEVPGSAVIRKAAAGGGTSPATQVMNNEIRNIRGFLGVHTNAEGEITEIKGADEFGVFGKYGRVEQWKPRELQSSDLRNLNSSVDNIVSLIILERSGKQASDAEQERLKNIVAFLPGEDEASIRAKLTRLDELVSISQQQGAEAANKFLADAAGLEYTPGVNLGAGASILEQQGF